MGMRRSESVGGHNSRARAKESAALSSSLGSSPSPRLCLAPFISGAAMASRKGKLPSSRSMRCRADFLLRSVIIAFFRMHLLQRLGRFACWFLFSAARHSSIAIRRRASPGLISTPTSAIIQIKRGFFYPSRQIDSLRNGSPLVNRSPDLEGSAGPEPLQHYKLWSHLFGLVVPLLVGAWIGGWTYAILFPVAARTFLVLNSAFFINSVCAHVRRSTV